MFTMFTSVLVYVYSDDELCVLCSDDVLCVLCCYCLGGARERARSRGSLTILSTGGLKSRSRVKIFESPT